MRDKLNNSAGIRAIKTLLQTFLAVVAYNSIVTPELNWFSGVVIALIAAIFSIITSIVTRIPEVYDGTMTIMSTDDKDIYSLNLEHDVEELKNKRTIIFKVDSQDKPRL